MKNLNNDEWTKILLSANVEQLYNLSIINHDTEKFCNTKRFWLNRFSHDNIPFIINNDIKNIHTWIKHYKNIDIAYKTSKRFVNNLINENLIDPEYFPLIEIRFPDNVSVYNINWLPENLLRLLKDNPDDYATLYLTIDVTTEIKFGIEVDIFDDGESSDSDIEIYKSCKKELCVDEFILFFTKLFYFYPDVSINDNAVPDRDYDGIELSYKELSSDIQSLNLESVFPNW